VVLLEPPPAASCQVAAVQLVAVKTCQVVGAVADDTSIVVVALFKASVSQEVPVVSWLGAATSVHIVSHRLSRASLALFAPVPQSAILIFLVIILLYRC